MLFITLFIFSTSLYSQSLNTLFLKKAKAFISKNFKHIEYNPSHLKETNEINQYFFNVITHKKKYSNKDVYKVFKLLHHNSSSSYEDAPDSRRIPMRISLCFSTIALISSADKAKTYLRFAKLALIDSYSHKVIDLLEDRYAALLLLEIVLLHKTNRNINDKMKQLKKYLILNKNSIEEKSYQELSFILSLI